jgi:hypothetical protein
LKPRFAHEQLQIYGKALAFSAKASQFPFEGHGRMPFVAKVQQTAAAFRLSRGT